MNIMRVKQADGSIVSIPLGYGASGDGGYYIPSVTDNGNNTITISFTPSSNDMPAVDSVTFNAGDTQTLEEMLQGFDSDPGSVKKYVDSVAGEAGGYYIPTVVDHKDGTISIGFTPSESGMTQIAPFRLALPKGEDGAYVTGITEMGGDATKTTYRMEFSNGMGYDFDVFHGAKGDPGVTPIFETDEIITLEPGESAYVVIHNDDPENPIMDFGIPRGEKGDKGDSGVYVGSGDMPDGYNVQIDPDGEAIEVINGKSAYEYAKEGGYTGTEAEFATKLARDYDTMIAQKLPINQGAANVGKILVVGTDGNLTLADMPEGGAIGDVVGVLDGANNILLTGALASGTYTLKYEYEDGTVADVGTIEVGAIPEPEPTKTNFIEPNTDNTTDWSIWCNDARIGSDGAYRDSTTQDVTNYIAVQNGDIIHINQGRMINAQTIGFYNGSKAKVTAGATTNLTSNGHISDATTINASTLDAQFTITNASVEFIRFTLLRSSFTVTDDEIVVNIERNGEYL